jgi:hypothetical protein
MLIRLLVGATALILTSSPALADCIGTGRHDPAVLRYICQSERAWSNSVANGDTTVPNRILADDYSGVGWSGEFYGKAEMAAMAPKTSKTVASQDQEEAHVRFYGNTAVAQGADKFRTKSGAVSRIVWTDVWLKRHGKWQIIASQDLPLRASQ